MISPTIGGILGIALTLLLLFMRVPVGVAISLPSIVCIGLILGDMHSATTVATSTFFSVFTQDGFAVIPLFIVMGTLAYTSGIADDLFGMLQRWVGGIRGGLAMATINACAMFGAVTGSSIATVATFSKSALPTMLAERYSPRLAAGVVAAAGSLGSLIPPSTILVIYGLIAQVSIGALLIAAIIPALLKVALFLVRIAIFVRVSPELAPPQRRYTMQERWTWTLKGWPVLAVFAVVIGGIYSGVWTITESAAAGVASVAVLAALRRKLTLRELWEGCREGVAVAASITFIVGGAFILARLLALSGINVRVVDFFASLDVAPVVVFSLFLLTILFLGTIIDTVTVLALTVPIMLPVMTSLGYDPIWFGVVMVLAVEVGAYTPPFGLNVFALVATNPHVSLSETFRGALPFAIFDIIDIYILLAFPQLVLWLPGLAG